MKIQKISELAKGHGIKAILHGPSGAGKTYSISTIPNQEKVIVLSCEPGLLSIEENCADVAGIKIENIEQLREAYDFLSGKGGKEYETIVLDSLTEIAEKVLTEEFEKSKDGRKAYGELKEKATKLIKAFRDLPGKNVILICQQSKEQDDEGRMFYGPSMPGKKLAQSLPYWVDLVICLRVRKNEEGETERAFQCTAKDEQYIAKNRGGKLDDYEAPDWGVIFKKIGCDKNASKKAVNKVKK